MARGNLVEALRRLEQNAGAAGIDGMSTKELRPWLHDHWPQFRSQLEVGTYRPQPVRRVMIPKQAGVMDGGLVHASEEGTPQGSLCAAAHNEPYEQRWVMRSAGL